MAFSREFISNNRILFGIGALLVVGCAGAAETSGTPARPESGLQSQPPRAPVSATEEAKRTGVDTTPPVISSSHDVTKHGASGDPVVRPQKAKKPHDAVKSSVDDDIGP